MTAANAAKSKDNEPIHTRMHREILGSVSFSRTEWLNSMLINLYIVFASVSFVFVPSQFVFVIERCVITLYFFSPSLTAPMWYYMRVESLFSIPVLILLLFFFGKLCTNQTKTYIEDHRTHRKFVWKCNFAFVCVGCTWVYWWPCFFLHCTRLFWLLFLNVFA